VVMVAVTVSGSISWASYGSARYLKPDSSSMSVFCDTTAAMSISCAWLVFVGLVGASVLSNQNRSRGQGPGGGGALRSWC
jgi:purine-cytosine permease-like protein